MRPIIEISFFCILLLLLHVGFSGSQETASPDCPEYLNGNTSIPCLLLKNNETCYCFSEDLSVSWYEADQICRSGNMTLASLQSQAEDEAIRTHIESINSFINVRYYWLSGRCSGDEASQWVWNNEILEPIGCYNNWLGLHLPDQVPLEVPPECLSELHCMYYGRVFFAWRWKQTLCGTRGHFICEQNLLTEPENVTCTTPTPPTTVPPTTDTVLLTAIIIGCVASLLVLVIASFFVGFSIHR